MHTQSINVMNNDSNQRVSPQGDNREDAVGSLLAEASDFARGVLESIQALAGTTSCKGVQIARLKDWAITNQCLLDKDKLGSYSGAFLVDGVDMYLCKHHLCYRYHLHNK